MAKTALTAVQLVTHSNEDEGQDIDAQNAKQTINENDKRPKAFVIIAEYLVLLTINSPISTAVYSSVI